MAEHRRGRTDSARDALQRGLELMRKDRPQDNDLGNAWADWLRADEARRQAVELLEGKPAGRP